MSYRDIIHLFFLYNLIQKEIYLLVLMVMVLLNYEILKKKLRLDNFKVINNNK